jgi:hypothetical protein
MASVQLLITTSSIVMLELSLLVKDDSGALRICSGGTDPDAEPKGIALRDIAATDNIAAWVPNVQPCFRLRGLPIILAVNQEYSDKFAEPEGRIGLKSKAFG